MEKILEIKEVDSYKIPNSNDLFEGYIVKTTKRQINCLIDICPRCCEYWGYLTSEDDLNYYVGSELLSVESVSGENFNKKLLEGPDVTIDDCMFLEFKTSRGSFQLVVYNDHSGDYSHTVLFNQEELYL